MKKDDFVDEENKEDLPDEESLNELEEDENEEFSWHKLDTFSEEKKHDWTYSYDDEYFEK